VKAYVNVEVDLPAAAPEIAGGAFHIRHVIRAIGCHHTSPFEATSYWICSNGSDHTSLLPTDYLGARFRIGRIYVRSAGLMGDRKTQGLPDLHLDVARNRPSDDDFVSANFPESLSGRFLLRNIQFRRTRTSASPSLRSGCRQLPNVDGSAGGLISPMATTRPFVVM